METGPHDYVYDPSGGYGVDVYVFDTGIYRYHPSFGNRVKVGMDFTGEGMNDDNGHGMFFLFFFFFFFNPLTIY